MSRIIKTDAEWRALLTGEQYYVTRRKGTERPYSGAYLHNRQAGVYGCVCCGAPLFASDAQFDSGCGWPAFRETLDPTTLVEHEDREHGMRRTEVRCAQCQAHLGHVFTDGPPPAGLRYCINSVALRLNTADDASDR